MTVNRHRARVVLCRGCCCGTTSKHPGADHEGQAARLAQLPARQAAFTTSACLGRCDDGNNIVVIPSPAGRARGGTPVWLGRMLRPGLTEAVTQWVAAGGPGIAPLPAVLQPHLLVPRQNTVPVTAAAQPEHAQNTEAPEHTSQR